MASSKETYCLCGQPYNVGQFMIECDCCREWFHGSCVDVKIYQSDDIDKYHCPKCSPTYGPSVLKVATNNHRADRYEIGAEARSAQAGTPAWVRTLAARPLQPVPQALQRLLPQQFTEEFIKDNGFTKPVVFHTPEGLDLKMPNAATFTVRSVLRYCGAQLEVEVIDVRKQATVRMTLGDFVDYFETPPEQRDEKVLNVLSLEFSDTSMAALVEPPAAARRLDWARRVWPAGKEGAPRPSVAKYCLMSAAGSYTDFHVDFGGTTVWYHVLHGRKIFYLVPPTSTNLALYQQWSSSNNQSERFFGDMVEWYGTAELLPGETLFIPAGWLHAVLSPDDCLVFGGNLLHEYSIEMQLQIYEIERRVETPMMLRYPLFETMHWFAGSYLLTMLRRHNEDTQDEDFTLHEGQQKSPRPELPALLVRGVRILATALKEWHALKSTDQQKRDNVPKCINSGQIVKELCRELRTFEKRSSVTTKEKDVKVKNHSSPTKSHNRKHSNHNSHKKSLKLTLPKPIMHMVPDDKTKEEDMYASKTYVEKVVYDDASYMPQDMKYNGAQDETKQEFIDVKDVVLQKSYTYTTFEDHYSQDGNGYVDKKSSVLRLKLNNSPSSSREDPPPYSLPEHSILKSHLIGRPVAEQRPPTLKPIHQWTISKKDMTGEYQEEQQILFTNENIQSNINLENQDISYGPGMYSTEDIQPDYHYSESAKPGSYQPDYSYQNPNLPPDLNIAYPVDPNGYVNGRSREVYHTDLEARYDNKTYEITQQISEADLTQLQSTTFLAVPLNGYHQEQLPSYDAAIAQQYGSNFIIEEQKPPAIAAAPSAPSASAPAPRRSERPVRRRVSPTYDYEDGDLYIDEAPPPARRRAKHRHQCRHAVPSSGFRQTQRAVPANGIESLIQASVLAEEPQDKTYDNKTYEITQQISDADPTQSQSTTYLAVPLNSYPFHPPNCEDAAAAMLSISGRYSAPNPPSSRTFGLASTSPSVLSSAPSTAPGTPSPSSRRARRPAAPVVTAPAAVTAPEPEEDVIKEVHRDEEYVYPSLEMSSEDEEEWNNSRRRRNSRNKNDAKVKSEKDESWSPRARLGRLVPRTRGPARSNVRRECVRAALHAAANSAPHHHHPRRRDPAQQSAKRAVIATKSRKPPPPVPTAPNNNKNMRLKKGMKTAKQRLGKILKIHKMIY